MNKLHKRYNVYRNIEPQTSQLEEQLKNVDPTVFMRISPDARISLSCGEGIDFDSCWHRYNALHSSSYSTTRKRLISQLLAAYGSISHMHEGYKEAPHVISLKTLTIESKYEDAESARDKEVENLNRQKENVPIKKYTSKPTSPSFLTSRQVVEDDLRREAIARFSKFGISNPSDQIIQNFISEHIEDVLAMERRHSEELSDYNRKVEETLAISINAEYQREHDEKINEIEDKIRSLYRNVLSIDQFYDDEINSFSSYLDSLFRDLKSPYPMDILVDYDQNTASAVINISFPEASKCNLPVRIAKMAGKEIQVFEYPSSAIAVEYAKSISGMAYYIAVSLLDHNPYLANVIISATDREGKNGLFAALFSRSDFKGVNLSDDSIERLMSRFIIIADYPSENYAFSPIPINRFNQQLQSLVKELANGKSIINTIAVPIVQAQAIVKQIHSAKDVETAIADAIKNNSKSVRIDGKYASILKELGYDASCATSKKNVNTEIADFTLVGCTDISTEMTGSTSVDLFLEWRKKKKNVLEMRGVSEVDYGKIRMTQRFVTTRYSARLLNKFNISAWGVDYVFISKTRLAQLEAAHLPEEYTNYLQEFGAARIEKAKEYEFDGKFPRAIKEYERCLEYGCPLEAPFDNLIRLYNQIGDSENVARVKELKRKTWG